MGFRVDTDEHIPGPLVTVGEHELAEFLSGLGRRRDQGRKEFGSIGASPGRSLDELIQAVADWQRP